MIKRTFAAGVLGLGLLSLASVSSQAAVYSSPGAAAFGPDARRTVIEQVQYWRGRPYGARGYAPGGYWYHRPWVRRPYYGRIIAGVALGTLIGVAVAGVVPPRPAPDLCWYWNDPYQTRGYWDYCY